MVRRPRRPVRSGGSDGSETRRPVRSGGSDGSETPKAGPIRGVGWFGEPGVRLLATTADRSTTSSRCGSRHGWKSPVSFRNRRARIGGPRDTVSPKVSRSPGDLSEPLGTPWTNRGPIRGGSRNVVRRPLAPRLLGRRRVTGKTPPPSVRPRVRSRDDGPSWLRAVLASPPGSARRHDSVGYPAPPRCLAHRDHWLPLSRVFSPAPTERGRAICLGHARRRSDELRDLGMSSSTFRRGPVRARRSCEHLDTG